MAAHTPGPWRVFEHSWSNCSIVSDHFDHGICGLDINHATEESQEADEALMAANARLIAAAPQMLDALRIALPYMLNSEGFAAKAIRDAIAKAGGLS